MPALQVREFPDDLYEELRAYAAKNHRSIAQQTVACVENELKRAKAFTAWAGSGKVEGEDDIVIPENVRAAAARAHFVDPFRWFSDLGVEPEEEVEARREKRRRLLRRIDEFNEKYDLSAISMEETVRMIREDRDGDHGRFGFDMDGWNHASGDQESESEVV